MAYRRVESDEDIDILVSMARRDVWSDCFKDMFDSNTLQKLIESAQSIRGSISANLSPSFATLLYSSRSAKSVRDSMGSISR